jgi:RNA polymerase sigma factor (sigma-70 family)
MSADVAIMPLDRGRIRGVSDVLVEELVAAAGAGDQDAWRELVDRYGRTVWAVTHSFRLSDQDAQDVSQTAWLLLAVHLKTIENPVAVGAWLATTARRECLRLLRRRGRELPADPLDAMADRPDTAAEQAEDTVLRAELRALVRAAFAQLPEPCRRLLALLLRDPPPSYDVISAKLGIPRGGIGPTRRRCLDRLRKVVDL